MLPAPRTGPDRRVAGRFDAIHGLYIIADRSVLADDDLVPAVAAALAGGGAVVQLRDKQGDAPTRRQIAAELAALCRENHAAFVINDDLELARSLGAGVHLGRDDAGLATARRRLGPAALIGVSCYDSLERARGAAATGASYVAFGSIYPSLTKPGAARAPLTLLTQARHTLTIPVVAIGGITPENASAVIAAGAHAVAVITGLFPGDGSGTGSKLGTTAAEIMTAARRYRILFPTAPHQTPRP